MDKGDVGASIKNWCKVNFAILMIILIVLSVSAFQMYGMVQDYNALKAAVTGEVIDIRQIYSTIETIIKQWFSKSSASNVSSMKFPAPPTMMNY